MDKEENMEGHGNDFKIPKIMTPEQFLQSIPKDLNLDDKPKIEPIDVRGNIFWCGHLHHEDLEYIVNSLQEVFNFEILEKKTNEEKSRQDFSDYLRSHIVGEDMFSVKGEWKIAINGDTSTLKMGGMHSFPEVEFLWSTRGNDLISKLYKASQLYEEVARNKDSRFTFTNAKVMGWYLGASWQSNKKLNNFMSNDKGTIFCWCDGNRDEFRYESKIPASRWIFDSPKSKNEYQSIMDRLWDGYDVIKDKVLLYDISACHSTQILSKEKSRYFHVNIKFRFNDLGFKPYIPYKSAIELAERYQKHLNDLGQGKVVEYPKE